MASPAAFPIRRNLPSPKLVAIGGLVAILFGLSGCASSRTSIKSIWDQVPSVRWSGKNQESDESIAQVHPSEPVVAANVAVKPTEVNGTDPAEAASIERSFMPSFNWFDGRQSQSENSFADEFASSDLVDSSTASTEPAVTSDRSDTSIDRLNAALTQDTLQNQTLPERSLTTLDDRLQVDSLLFKARRLLEVGQLEQARHAAQAAQELGDRAQLDYSPDEERPIDVVRLIDRQLEATTVEVDSPVSPEKSARPKKTETSDRATGTGDNSKSAGKSLIRRDWSAFFRREKKQVGPDPEPAAIAKKSSRFTEPYQSLPSRKVAQTAGSGVREAIVMANRSVSLGAPESVTLSISEDSDDEVPELETQVAFDISSTNLTPTQRTLVSMEKDTVTSKRSNNETSDSEVDDSGNSPPDFDIAESPDPFEQPMSSLNDRTRASSTESLDVAGEFNWNYLYLVLGICSVLAWICYQRGAT